MHQKKVLILVIGTVTLISLGCGVMKMGIVTPTGAPNDSPPQSEVQPEADAISSTPIRSVVSGANLPAPLYFRINYSSYTRNEMRIAWRLDPGKYLAKMIAPIDTTSFDIWQQDGRMAYANKAGELYIVMPGEEPELAYDIGQWMNCDLKIGSLAWSPDGGRLAYSVDLGCPNGDRFEDPGLMGKPTGVWVLELADQSTTQLLRNRYLDSESTDFNKLRIVTHIAWAPDDEALLLNTVNGERKDVYWLYPLVFSDDEANLHDPAGTGWMDAAWGKNGQTVLLSGVDYSNTADLIRVNRSSMHQEVLIDGGTPDQDVVVSQAQELSKGIAFFISPFARDAEVGSRLYLGNESSEGFNYTTIGPDRNLCEFAPSHVAWDASETLAVIVCDDIKVQLISIDGSIDINLTPYLSTPLAQVHNIYELEIFWGAEN